VRLADRAARVVDMMRTVTQWHQCSETADLIRRASGMNSCQKLATLILQPRLRITQLWKKTN
jgi:hypothetical protein